MTDPTARPQDEAAIEPETAAKPEQADPLAEATREAAEYKDKLLRTLAEMENLRKRTEREVADSRAYGITAFARDVLQIADNMHRAREAIGPELRESADANVKALLEGVELTERELLKVLEKNGVKKFSPQGEKFDPNFHQAMYEVADGSAAPGTVAQVIQAGYKIGDRVLRPALVAVAKAAPKVSANDNPPNGANSG
ncbi:MAG TPA: nucleotide exchange factor GrpE [Pseudolabrys sp.]|jgi:molecular chaperone GrpE|nr:nucleotide exchange factor GrpE [Pseudolabrys sp.]